MESLSTHIEVPSGWRVFLFGSALWREAPRDLDLLCIYDPSCVAAGSAYDEIVAFASAIAASAGLPLDLTVLSEREAAQTDFICRERCVALPGFSE
jgi:hypothetical protein